MGPDWLLVLVRLLLFVKSKWEAQITIHQLQLDAAIRKQHVNDGWWVDWEYRSIEHLLVLKSNLVTFFFLTSSSVDWSLPCLCVLVPLSLCPGTWVPVCPVHRDPHRWWKRLVVSYLYLNSITSFSTWQHQGVCCIIIPSSLALFVDWQVLVWTSGRCLLLDIGAGFPPQCHQSTYFHPHHIQH